jgi:hypothetical protein
MARKAAIKTTEHDNADKALRQPVTLTINNSLKLRIDDLKTFDPLTENQKLFFDAYK